MICSTRAYSQIADSLNLKKDSVTKENQLNKAATNLMIGRIVGFAGLGTSLFLMDKNPTLAYYSAGAGALFSLITELFAYQYMIEYSKKQDEEIKMLKAKK